MLELRGIRGGDENAQNITLCKIVVEVVVFIVIVIIVIAVIQRSDLFHYMRP